MAILSTVAGSYVPPSSITTVLREELYEVVTNVDPTSTPVLDMLSSADFGSPIYQWEVDSLPGIVLNNTAGSVDVDGINAQGIIEGFDGTSVTSYPYTGQPERLTNYIQLFAAKVQVSDTLKGANPSGVRDPYNWEKVKAGRVMKKAMERRLFDNASANASFSAGTVGSGTTVPYRMKALFEWTTGNYVLNQVTVGATGGLLNPASVDAIMEATVTIGGSPSTLAVPVGSKIDLATQLRSAPGAINTVSSGSVSAAAQTFRLADPTIGAMERTIIRSVDLYDGDYGAVNIVMSRQIPQSSATTGGGKAWALEMSKIQFGFYTPMKHIPLAKTGYNTKGIVVAEAGNRVLNPRAIGVINNVTT